MSWGLTVCLLLAGLLQHSISQTPSISYISPGQTKDAGETVVITCYTQNISRYPPFWVKLDSQLINYDLIAVEDNVLSDEPRYSVKLDNTTQLYQLTISNSHANDSGTYRCAILNDFTNPTYKDTSVRVRDTIGRSFDFSSEREKMQRERLMRQHPAEIIYVTPYQSKGAGDSVELSCSVRNAEYYTVVWSKKVDPFGYIPVTVDDSVVVPDSRYYIFENQLNSTYTLRISDVDDTDAGIYRCEVPLTYFQKLTKDTQLDVAGSTTYPTYPTRGTTRRPYPTHRPFPTYRPVSTHRPFPTRHTFPTFPTFPTHPTFPSVRDPFSDWRSQSRSFISYSGAENPQVQNVPLVGNSPQAAPERRAEESQTTPEPAQNKNSVISYVTPSVIAAEGEDVVIRCYMKNLKSAFIQWYRTSPGAEIRISTTSTRLISDRRFEVEIDENTKIYKLTIRNARQSDSGTYTCEVLGDYDKTRKNSEVTIHSRDAEYPPQPDPEMPHQDPTPDQRDPRYTQDPRYPHQDPTPDPEPVQNEDSVISYVTPSVIAAEGEEVNIHCYLKNFDSAFIQWYKTGPGAEKLISSKNMLLIGDRRFEVQMDENAKIYELTIRDARQSDSGTYSCEVIGDYDKTRKNSEVTIHPRDAEYPPQPDPRYPHQDPTPDPRDPRYTQDPRYPHQDPTPDPRDPRYTQDPRYPHQDPTPDPRYTQDPRYPHQDPTPDPRYTQDPRYPHLDPTPDPRYRQPEPTNQAPVISYISPPQEKDAGDSVVLDCYTQNVDDVLLFWTKDGDETIISVDDEILSDDPRFSVKVDNQSQIYQLTMNNIQDKDSGSYRCFVLSDFTAPVFRETTVQVRQNYPTARAEEIEGDRVRINLLNERPPEIVHTSPGQSKRERDRADLACWVINGEYYSVVWSKKVEHFGYIPISVDDEVVYPDSRFALQQDKRNSTYSTYTLKIRNLEPDDTGIYRCEVYLTWDSKLKKESQLQVVPDYDRPQDPYPGSEDPYQTTMPPNEPEDPYQRPYDPNRRPQYPGTNDPYSRPEIAHITPDTQAGEGEEVVLACTVQNRNNEPVIWIKDGTTALTTDDLLLSSDRRYRISIDPQGATFYLRINGLYANDTGSYSCKVVLEDGTKLSQTVRLYVGSRPTYETTIVYDKNPLIRNISGPLVREVGEKVTLSCSVENIADQPVLWVKNGVSPISTDADLLVFDSRYDIVFDERSSTYYLTINNLREDDSGSYSCEILLSIDDPNEKISQNVDLQVRQQSPPTNPNESGTPSITYISPNQMKNIGESVTFECIARNTDDFPVFWTKDVDISGTQSQLPIASDEDLLVSDSRYAVFMDEVSEVYTLRINDLQERDSGTYHCEVHLSLLEKFSKDVDLNVGGYNEIATPYTPPQDENKPVISFITPSDIKREGDSLYLRCVVENRQNYPVLWMKDDNITISSDDSILLLDPRYAVMQSGDSFDLTINYLRDTDSGTYTCVVLPSLFEHISEDVEIQVHTTEIVPTRRPHDPDTDHPKIVYITPSRVIEEGDTLSVSCSTENPSDVIGWYQILSRDPQIVQLSAGDQFTFQDRRYNILNGPGSSNLIIRNIREEDDGTFRCFAASAEGETVTAEVEIRVQRTYPAYTTTEEIYTTYPPETDYPYNTSPYYTTERISQRGVRFITSPLAKEMGDSVTLSCAMEDPRDEVTWSKVVVPNDPYYKQIISTGNNLSVSDSRYTVQFSPNQGTWDITISDLRQEDAGTYHCAVGRGPEETASADTRLDVHPRSPGRPDPVYPTHPPGNIVQPGCVMNEQFIDQLSTQIADAVSIKVLANMEKLSDEYNQIEEVVKQLQLDYQNSKREMNNYYH